MTRRIHVSLLDVIKAIAESNMVMWFLLRKIMTGLNRLNSSRGGNLKEPADECRQGSGCTVASKHSPLVAKTRKNQAIAILYGCTIEHS